jgi:HemY protein
MIRLLWRFGLIVLAALLFSWLADRPGSVTIRWLGREVEMSVVVGAALLLAGLVLLLFLYGLLRRLWRSPRAASSFLRERKSRKAYESLSQGIIAAGAGDAAAAQKHAMIAANGLADEPLVNVLAAQAAQLKGDRASVKRIFEAMTKSPETEALGLRGLFAEARQAGDATAARALAEKALRLNPRLAWASTAVLQLQSAARDWKAGAATLLQQEKSGLITREDSARKQAALWAAEALAIEDREKASALDLALRAHRLDAALVPAALVAARVLAAQGSPKKALRVIQETWAVSPHPDLAEVAAHAKPGEGPEARFERLRDLTRLSPGGLEGAYALARAAALAQRWDVARKTLEPHLAEAPQARLCALMADVEEAAGDHGRAREWLARALVAPRDPMWVSDGVASPRWTPVSPVTGDIVPCEWKPPFETQGPVSVLTAVPAAPQVTGPRPAAAATTTAALPRLPLPDDPGIDGDSPAPESAARRSLVSDG